MKDKHPLHRLSHTTDEVTSKILELGYAGVLPCGGGFSTALRQLQNRRRYRASDEAIEFLNGLSKHKIKSGAVLAILQGKRPPAIDVFQRLSERRVFEDGYREAKRKEEAITELNQEVRQLEGAGDTVLRSRLLSSSLREEFKKELAILQGVIDRVQASKSTPVLKPSEHFTVNLVDPLKRHKSDDDWSRQGFWNPVLHALMELWLQAGSTKYRAFKDIAHLLSLYFPPFPDKPSLLKRRYYHYSR